MSTVRDLHNEAMSRSDEAFAARRAGDLEYALNASRQALEFEMQAAYLLDKSPTTEPTRSVLFRSAATIAHEIGEWDLARQLTGEGLAGKPPPQIISELMELLERITFDSRVGMAEGELMARSIELSLGGGDSVGFGKVLVAEALDRLSSLSKLIDRTAERMSGRPYRRSGRRSPQVPFGGFVHAIAPGSFRALVEVGYLPDAQVSFEIDQESVAKEVAEGIRLAQTGQFEDLADRINDRVYFENFVLKVRDLAPDGRHVQFVGIKYQELSLPYSQTKSEMESATASLFMEEIPLAIVVPLVESTTSSDVVHTGELKHWDERPTNDQFQASIVTEDGSIVPFYYRESMEDRITELVGRPVSVRIVTQHGRPNLVNIDPDN